MKRYLGVIENRTPKAYFSDGLERTELPLRLDLCRISTGGFAWGYCGSGPAQLAVAILAHHLKDDEQALWFSDAFTRGVTWHLPQDKNWELTPSQIDAVLDEIVKSRGPGRKPFLVKSPETSDEDEDPKR
jgi:hypothetical protein